MSTFPVCRHTVIAMAQRFLLLCVLSVANGCGDRAVKTGVFIDSAVEGIEYSSGDVSGITNAAGEFSYRSADQVSFRLGQVELGQVRGQAVVSPLTLADTDNLSAPGVVNRARLLQSLDADLNPDNGITIEQAVREAAQTPIDFDQSITEFASDLAVVELYLVAQAGKTPTPSLVSVEDAQAHLRSSLDDLAANQVPSISLETSAQTVSAGERVVLTAQVSDPDGFLTDFTWQQITETDAPVVTLESISPLRDEVQDSDSQDSAETSFAVFFIAPEVSDTVVLNFEFTAVDNAQASRSETIEVTVNSE